MESKIVYPQNDECILNIENIQLILLVDKTNDVAVQALPRMTGTETYAKHTFHQHAHVEIFCCPGGCLSLNTTNGIIQLYKGDIAVIPSGIAHNMLPVLHDDYWASLRFQIIHNKQKRCKDLYSLFQTLCGDNSIKLFRNNEQLSDTLHYIFKNINTAEEPYPLVLSLFHVLYQLSISQPVLAEKSSPEDMLNHKDSDMQRNEVLHYFIHNCYMYPLTPSLLANELHISERQITRIVQSRYGMSFHKMLLQKRISVAEQMLKKSDIKVTEIAQAIGFHSPDIFYKEFRKKHGITPGEYRINNKV